MLRALCPLLLLLTAMLPCPAAPTALRTRTARSGGNTAAFPWQRAVERAILDMQKQGAGGYSTGDDAKNALVNAFTWDETLHRPRFDAATARPSFCSGAVYIAVLTALLRWEEGNHRRAISPEAWQALLPRHVKDGEGPWGYANANGPGYALLIARLGAGYSFTDPTQARPGDVAKIWWNDAIGTTERGHLVVLVRDKGDSLSIWSSNRPRDGQPGGYGLRDIPKSSIRRILFTRITNPAAFNKAAKLPDDAWLTALMTGSTTWDDCLSRLRLRTR